MSQIYDFVIITRLSLDKTSTVIGLFLVMCPWSNSNVSWPGYNCAVVAGVLKVLINFYNLKWFCIPYEVTFGRILSLFVFAIWLFKAKTKSKETSGLLEKQNQLFPQDFTISGCSVSEEVFGLSTPTTCTCLGILVQLCSFNRLALNIPLPVWPIWVVIHVVIILLAPWAGKINRISYCYWLPELVRWSYLSRSVYELCPTRKIYVLVFYPI